MKKALLLFIICLLCLFTSCTKENTTKTSGLPTNSKTPTSDKPSSSTTTNASVGISLDNYIDELIEKTPSYIPYWNKESFKGKWNYIDGVFLNSIVNLYYATKDSKPNKALEYKKFLIRYVNYYIDPNGKFLNLKDSEASGFANTELDTICASKILFDLYEITKDSRYKNAITFTHNALTNMPKAEGTPNYWHKTSYPNQIWLDGMYMYAPFLARYAVSYNKPELLDQIKSQYEYIRNNMFNEEIGLYYHGYDSTKTIFWANKETGCSQNFWLRSLGWYTVSLCDVLEYYPEGSNKEYLKSLLNEILDNVLEYQDIETKMFYQLVDKKDIEVLVPKYYLSSLKNTKYTNDSYISNYVESSGSSMIAYSLLKSSKFGYIEESYFNIGKEIFEGIYTHSFKDNKLNDICITAGLGPDSKQYRDGSMEYYLAEPVGSDDAKGVGPFIMSYLQYNYESINIPTPKLF
ncbi:MAG: glycoside hydrolase family 88 protein [Acholeplasmatales bacterium]|nr:glycoside hydrolase family 88 protein [Acholeplasmatales bacterium]